MYFMKRFCLYSERPTVNLTVGLQFVVVIYSHAIYACHKETGFQAYIEKQVLLCYYKLNIIY